MEFAHRHRQTHTQTHTRKEEDSQGKEERDNQRGKRKIAVKAEQFSIGPKLTNKILTILYSRVCLWFVFQPEPTHPVANKVTGRHLLLSPKYRRLT